MTPQRLGRPPEGGMRNLTLGEATETGLSRTSLVAVLAGEVVLFRSVVRGGKTQRYVLVRSTKKSDPYEDLRRYWAR